MHNFRAVSAYSEIAFKDGRKVKDMEIVKQNNNGTIRQFIRNNMASRRRRNKHVRFAKSNPISKRNSPTQLGLSFRRMPTPYFTRNRKLKGLRKYGKNHK